MGYLYLSGQMERLEELIRICLSEKQIEMRNNMAYEECTVVGL